jgi:hypothetical protein
MTDVQYQTALSLYGQGRHAEGTQLLGQAAQGGHVPSMTLLGHQFLSGRGVPLDPIAGVRLIVAAAEGGGGMACATAASLLAAGAGGRPDWHRALDYLRRSAELGFPKAQVQLRLLAGRDGDNWRVLRREIDIKAWRQTPKPRVLSHAPRVQALDGVVIPAICDWIIAQARDRLRPAMIYDAGGGHTTSAGRSNSAVELSLTDGDVVSMAVRERLAAAAGFPVMNLDGPQVLHYAVGQSFARHVDYFDEAIPNQANQMAANGQRVATVLLYLNDEGLEGGETDFPELDFKHRGRRGDVLVFFNVDQAGKPDRRTVHAGLAPTLGEKWLMSQWIRDRAVMGAGHPDLVAALNGR